jgi:predicted transcriptional regulator
MVNLDTVKRNLSEAILQSGLTQTEIARMLSISQSCVAHYVRGDILPSLDTFANLCELLDLDPADLLGLKKS